MPSDRPRTPRPPPPSPGHANRQGTLHLPADLPAERVALLHTLADRRRDRRRAADQERLVVERRPGERIPVATDDLTPRPFPTRAERAAAERLTAELLPVALAARAPFAVRLFPLNHLWLAYLDGEPLNALMRALQVASSLLTRAVQAEARRMFGDRPPTVPGQHGPVPDAQTLMKYSAPFAEAVVRASEASDRLWTELLRRERVSADLGWPRGSVGELAVRALPADLTAPGAEAINQRQARLDDLAWLVLGRAFTPDAPGGRDPAERARASSWGVALSEAGSAARLRPEELDTLHAHVERVALELDEARLEVLADGLGLDWGRYLASNGRERAYVYEPESVVAQWTARFPTLTPARAAQQAVAAVREGVASGRVRLRLDPVLGAFMACGLHLDPEGRVRSEGSLTASPSLGGRAQATDALPVSPWRRLVARLR